MSTTVERLTEYTTGIEIRREDFGPGYAGDWSYQTVLAGAMCVSYIDENKTECGKPSVGTVDVDIRATLDLFPYCSAEHAERLELDLVEEIEAQGRFTVPGRNGFGRA